MQPKTKKIQLVITDLDNTLYNWVDYYVPSFLAMVEEIQRISGVDCETLKASFKRLHEKYRTSEYSLAIEKLDILREVEPGKSPAQILEKYWSAVEIFRRVRDSKLDCYPSVRSTLKTLCEQGRHIIAHTDSIGFYAVSRLKALEIEQFFHGICAPVDNPEPEDLPPKLFRSREHESYVTKISNEIPLRPEMRKPDPEILRTILDNLSVSPNEALLVGDSIGRDIVMAQECGVLDVHAKYGTEYDPANYEQLKKITYWTEADIQREAQARPKAAKPTFTIASFSDLLEVIESVENQISV